MNQRNWNRERAVDRAVHQMLGIVHGVLADGVVSDQEARALADWLDRNQELRDRWPVSVLRRRLERIFADGRVDDDERRELAELLDAIDSGAESIAAAIVAGHAGSLTLPLDEPETLDWDGHTFVFVGRFAYGSLDACREAVQTRGGRCDRLLTEDTDYLVLGTLEQLDWRESSLGPAIRKALEFRDRRHLPIAIIAEHQWAEGL